MRKFILSLALLVHSIGFMIIGWYGYGLLFFLIAVLTRPNQNPPQGN